MYWDLNRRLYELKDGSRWWDHWATANPLFLGSWLDDDRRGGSPAGSWSIGYGRTLTSKGCGFKSRQRILDGHFFTYIVKKNCNVCLKRPKINDERGRGWPIKKEEDDRCLLRGKTTWRSQHSCSSLSFQLTLRNHELDYATREQFIHGALK